MPHITLTDGVLGSMLFHPETAKPMNQLAEGLLRGPNSLSPPSGNRVPPLPRRDRASDRYKQ
jgi:hypothetical protein